MGKIPSSEYRLRSFKYQLRASKSRSIRAVTGQLGLLPDNTDTALGGVTDQRGEIPGGREITKLIRDRALALHIPQECYADPRLQSVVSIFRVPNFLKELKMKAYVPQAVSLGPYHFNRGNLSGMDDHKKRALRRMMTRFNNMRGATDPDNYMDFSFRAIEKIFEDVENIKNSYEEKIECKPEYLAVMLTLDGCFILEILRTLAGDDLNSERSDKYEPIFDRRKIENTGFDVLNDILMLENQIPFTVLRKLLELEFNSVYSVEEFLLDVLLRVPGTRFYPFDYEKDMERWSQRLPDRKAHHFLGLLHSLIVSPPSDHDNDRAIPIDNNGKKKSEEDHRCIPCAVELGHIGIKFQRCNGGIKQIYFDGKKATIFLPPINVTDHTEVLFRNLIALELCQATGDNYVSCYLCLMNNLIHTEKDVGVLRKSKIVKNYLGSDAEVARLFNCLCREITLPRDGVLAKLQDDVMDHCNSNKLKVTLIAQFLEERFSPTWKFVGMLGMAILVLFLTLLQAIFSILQVYK